MKKLLTITLLLSMLLTSCGSNNKNDSQNGSGSQSGSSSQNGNGSQNGEDTSMMGEMGETVESIADDILPGDQSGSESDSTLGDENGDGTVESSGNSNSMMSGQESGGIDGEMTQFEPVTEISNADDAVNFIAANVYSKCADAVPMMTETRILSKDDLESVTYNTGLTDITGINDIILSESMVGSFAYSLVMLRTDGSSTAQLQQAMNEQINPAKWVCVAAEAVRSVTLDDDVVLVMGGSEQVDTIMNAVTEAAADVYTDVGSVMSVLG